MNLRTLLLYNKQICTILVTTRCLVESGSASFTNSHQNRFCRGNDPRAQCCDVCQVLKSICAWRFRLGNLSCCALGWENQKVLLILLFYIFHSQPLGYKVSWQMSRWNEKEKALDLKTHKSQRPIIYFTHICCTVLKILYQIWCSQSKKWLAF